MIKLLTFDNLFPPLRHLKLVVEWRCLSRFAAKMTLVHGSWAILSIEKIAYSKSFSSQNLQLCIIDTSLYAGTIIPRLSDLYWVTRKIELTFASDQWSSLCNGLLYIYIYIYIFFFFVPTNNKLLYVLLGYFNLWSNIRQTIDGFLISYYILECYGHVTLSTISKIQLVVYYQCCVLISWVTTRLYVIAH